MNLTKDLVQQLSKYVDDKTLLALLRTNRNLYYNEDLLRDIFLQKYLQLKYLKTNNLSWRQLLLETMKIISKMKEEYKFDYYQYNMGDPNIQYQIFNKVKYENDMFDLLIKASKEGELALIKFALDNGADIHEKEDCALRMASQYGHLQIVKYLVQHGAEINTLNENAMDRSIEYGHLEIVKYLVDNGGDLDVSMYYGLIKASRYGYLEVVKYLIEKGADIHAVDDAPLRWASDK